MRIIDKNVDFYDYIAGIYRDNSFTFDRSDSFLLTKDIFAQHLYANKYGSYYKRKDKSVYYDIVLMQVCNTFWLFSVEPTKIDDYNRVQKYQLRLEIRWSDYNCSRKLIRLETISLPFKILPTYKYSTIEEYSDGISQHMAAITCAIASGEFKTVSDMCYHKWYNGFQWVEKHIPLLKACGIAELVDPMDIYLALEQYFSLEKQSLERTESRDLTDKEKIGNHGFDVKTSFRGKY